MDVSVYHENSPAWEATNFSLFHAYRASSVSTTSEKTLANPLSRINPFTKMIGHERTRNFHGKYRRNGLNKCGENIKIMSMKLGNNSVMCIMMHAVEIYRRYESWWRKRVKWKIVLWFRGTHS